MNKRAKVATAPIDSPAITLVPVTQLRKVSPGDTTASQDCIEELRYLLQRAEAGKVLGLAYVVMNEGKSYDTKACGLANKNATFRIGMLEVLKARLLNGILKL